MDEDTSTAPATDVQTAAVEPAQPVTDVSTEAPDVPTTAEPSEPQQAADAEAPSVPEADEKLQKFAKSQGLELDSPSAIKAAQLAMKSRSEATRNYQRTTELEKSVTQVSDQYAETEAANTGQDPELLKTVRGLQIKDAVRDFWDANPGAQEYEKQMIDIVTERPYLAGDFEALYAMAVHKSGSSNVDSVKSQAKRETLEELAHTQTAAVPRGNATNPSTAPAAKPFNELSISEMEKKLGFVRR